MQQQQLEQLKPAQLYGGAITTALPSRFVDVSQMRQVPDHQEVYVDMNSDQSIIFELLSMDDVANDRAAQHHWNDLAQANDAETSSRVVSTERLSHNDIPHFAYVFLYFLLSARILINS
jgi:hypothetical protein